MRRTRATTQISLMMLLGCGLLPGALGAGCSRAGGPSTGALLAAEVGSVKLALTAPGGYTINTVSYQVLSSASATVSSGTVDVSSAGAGLSFDLVLPPGSGYTVTVTAASTSGRTFSGVSLPFNVVSGQTTLVNVTLTDSVTSGTATGTVIVNGTIVPGDTPPKITAVVVSPAQIAVGGLISVSVTATDPDTDDVLTYQWTASAGAFANPTAQATTYSSSITGTQTLTITVSDNHSPTPLSTFISLPVTVVAATGGSGGAGGPGTGGASSTGGAGTWGSSTGGSGTGTGGAASGGRGTGGVVASGGSGTGGASSTGGASTGGSGTGGRGTGGVVASGGAGTGGAVGTGGSDGGTGGSYLALQNAELATGSDPVLLTATSDVDPDTGEAIAVGWGPNTLPTVAERNASFALIRRIRDKGCSTNSTNTAPGTWPQLGCLLGQGAPLSNAFAGIFADPSVSAVNEYKAAAVASGLRPTPTGAPVTAASSNVDFGNAIAAAATDPTNAVGLSDNIAKVAFDFSLVSQLAAF